MSNVKVLLPLVGASKGWRGDSFQRRENLQIAWMSHSWLMVPWEELKAVRSSSQRPEVIRRVKQKRGWQGRWSCVFGKIWHPQRVQCQFQPPLYQPCGLILTPPLLWGPSYLRGHGHLSHSWCEDEQAKQLSLPWKTQGPTNSMTPDSLSFSNALA